MTLAWVVGQGGLLGSALVRDLRARGCTVFAPEQRFAWQDPATLCAQMPAAVATFAQQCSSGHRNWQIHWAAGVGTMSAPRTALQTETSALRGLIEAVAGQPVLTAAAGGIALASSAGAIYAGSKDPLVSETSAEAPTSPYAEEKLVQEALLAAFGRRHPGQRTLAARISTIYGVGQDPAKKQGLLTQLARNIVHGRMTSIFVPLDTIRDYLHADDAAAQMVDALAAAQLPPARPMKIIASERPTTIAEIITVFRRIARRTPRIVTATTPAAALYLRCQRFRSVIEVAAPARVPRPLLIGVSELMAAERAAYTRQQPGQRA
jgi:UDP-glucose 4-epimerase